jgi:molybdopterin converting factor subunit 1
MRIRVRLFAAAREIVGQGEVAIEMKDGSTVGDLMESVFSRHPGLKGMAESLVFAVNRELAERSAGLQDGDEVGVIPPVSGGTDV